MSTKKYYATEEYVADAIAGLSVGTGGGVSSWNDLADKPFYKEETLILTDEFNNIETQLTEYNNEAGITIAEYFAENVFTSMYTSGEPKDVVVEFDGVRYDVHGFGEYWGCYIGELGMGNCGVTGNPADVDKYKTWLPFTIVSGERDGSGTYFFTKEPGVHTFKIYEKQVNKKTLDTEFLPEGYPTVSYTKGTLVDNVAIDIPSNLYIDNAFDIGLVVGQTYTIMYDGDTYEFECYDSEGCPTIGNIYTDNDPFTIYCNPDSNKSGISTSVAGVHTITIKSIVEEVTPMAQKFMPELILTSPNGTKYKLTVSDDGTLSAVIAE